jgi:hypothetical protein
MNNMKKLYNVLDDSRYGESSFTLANRLKRRRSKIEKHLKKNNAVYFYNAFIPDDDIRQELLKDMKIYFFIRILQGNITIDEDTFFTINNEYMFSILYEHEVLDLKDIIYINSIIEKYRKYNHDNSFSDNMIEISRSYFFTNKQDQIQFQKEVGR